MITHKKEHINFLILHIKLRLKKVDKNKINKLFNYNFVVKNLLFQKVIIKDSFA